MRDFSSRYDIDLKTKLTPDEQNELEQVLKKILQQCPPICMAHLEVTSIRNEVCLNMELQGLLMPITVFAIGPIFKEVLNDLEMELAIQLNHGASSGIDSLIWAV